MKEITDIKPQIKDKNRCSIFLDGKFFCGLLQETAVKAKLKVGTSISEKELETLQLESEKHTALDKAFNYLSFCSRTKKQIEKYLIGKGYTMAVIDFVQEKLKNYSFIDDGAYALNYASAKGKTKGKRLIKLELMRLGVGETEIENALESLGEQTQTASAILIKYLRNKEITKENLQKAYRYLISKGFTYETAKDAIVSFGDLDDENY